MLKKTEEHLSGMFVGLVVMGLKNIPWKGFCPVTEI